MDNLTSAIDSIFTEVNSSSVRNDSTDLDSLNAKHQIWMQRLTNKYEILTHKLWILLIFVIVFIIFVITRYKIVLSNENCDIYKQINSDAKYVLTTFGISSVTWLITKHLENRFH